MQFSTTEFLYSTRTVLFNTIDCKEYISFFVYSNCTLYLGPSCLVCWYLLQVIIRDLKSLGYVFQFSKMDAQNYLLTQRRTRVYGTGDLEQEILIRTCQRYHCKGMLRSKFKKLLKSLHCRANRTTSLLIFRLQRTEQQNVR